MRYAFAIAILGLLFTVPTQAALTQQQFNSIINEFKVFYTPLMRQEGLTLKFDANWNESKVLAGISIPKNQAVLTISGGNARQEMMTEDAFRIILCHEMGHVLGGAPKRSPQHWSSTEGQADYYATSKCMKMMIPENENRDERILSAALVLGKMNAIYNKEDPNKITLESKDPNRLAKTTTLHPSAQCRMDTMVSGLICPISETIDFSNNDPDMGACRHASTDPEERAGARPRCWYRPVTDSYRCGSVERLPMSNSSISVLTVNLDDYRDDRSYEANITVSVMVPMKGQKERVLSDERLNSIEGEKILMKKMSDGTFRTVIEERLFQELKKNSLIPVPWEKLKLNYQGKGKLVFNLECKKI